MKIAKLAVMIVLLVPAVRAQQAPPSTTTHQLTAMLNQFLDDASNGNRAGFDRFFADDVIYTGSNALVRTKPEIMKNVGSMKPTRRTRRPPTPPRTSLFTNSATPPS